MARAHFVSCDCRGGMNGLLKNCNGRTMLTCLCSINSICVAVGLVVLVTITTVSTFPPPREEKVLKLVHVVMRHGVRTPVDTYPNDPYKDHDFAPNGWGQLTIQGIKSLHDFGRLLRDRYGAFLGNRYNSTEFYSEATGVDRSIASLMTVNSGLWPPKGAQVWDEKLEWFPIPVMSQPLNEDMLLLVRKDCPQYNIELSNVQKSPEILAQLAQYKTLFDYVAEQTGKKIDSFADLEDVYTTLLAEREYGLELPKWTLGYFPDPMVDAASLNFVLKAYNDKLKRLKGGVLLKKLLGDWLAKVEGRLDRNMFLYGGHDSTVSNLLSSLNIFDPQVPNYGMAVILELFQKEEEYGVEIYVKNSSLPLYHMRIPGCEEFCPLGKLVKLTENVIPVDWAKECETDDPNYTTPKPSGP